MLVLSFVQFIARNSQFSSASFSTCSKCSATIGASHFLSETVFISLLSV